MDAVTHGYPVSKEIIVAIQQKKYHASATLVRQCFTKIDFCMYLAALTPRVSDGMMFGSISYRRFFLMKSPGSSTVLISSLTMSHMLHQISSWRLEGQMTESSLAFIHTLQCGDCVQRVYRERHFRMVNDTLFSLGWIFRSLRES